MANREIPEELEKNTSFSEKSGDTKIQAESLDTSQSSTPQRIKKAKNVKKAKPSPVNQTTSKASSKVDNNLVSGASLPEMEGSFDATFTPLKKSRPKSNQTQAKDEHIEAASSARDPYFEEQGEKTIDPEKDRVSEADKEQSTDSTEESNSQNVSEERKTANAINDAATLQDDIGFEPYVSALSKMILHNKTQTPLVVGLFGPWGSGKTSFMKQVDAAVQDKNNNESQSSNHSIFFEAWQYQNSKNLSGALLFNVFNKLEAKSTFNKKLIFRFSNAISEFNSIALIWNIFLLGLASFFLFWSEEWAYLAALPVVGMFLNKESQAFFKGLKVPMGIDVGQMLSNDNEALKATALHDFKGKLKNILDAFVEKDGRLIIYIDDLDRCTPPQVVSVLETLNILFDSDRCIFFLGIDKPKVIRAIETHYQSIADKTNKELSIHEKNYGEAFLEKIIQLGISVPSLDKESIEGFIDTMIRSSQGDEAEEPAIVNLILQQAIEFKVSDIEYDEQTADLLRESVLFLQPITPRSIKRYLNKFRFIYLLWASNKHLFSKVKADEIPFWFLLNELFPVELGYLNDTQSNGISANENKKSKVDYASLAIFEKIRELEKSEKKENLMLALERFVQFDVETKIQYLKLVQNTINKSARAEK